MKNIIIIAAGLLLTVGAATLTASSLSKDSGCEASCQPCPEDACPMECCDESGCLSK
jgi:hypothetical protein